MNVENPSDIEYMARKYKQILEYRNEYHKANYKNMHFAFDKQQDADILEKLSQVPNKADYIRSLIVSDLARRNQ